ncbi:hypothetical protein ACU4GD_00495 [Cupriavidus basilensis]
MQEQFDALWSGNVDSSHVVAASGRRAVRANLLFEAMPAEWFEGAHYRRHYLEVGHADSIQVRCSLNDDVRIHLFVFRDLQAPRFSAPDPRASGFRDAWAEMVLSAATAQRTACSSPMLR